jgi:predicted dehydrogenase
MDSLRWGVLSTARIAREKVMPAIRAAGRSELVALASREPDRARSLAHELAIPHVHDSYEALLADPEVDAVYVPLPNHLHVEWTLAAVRAGKHVLCEKPLALGAADAARVLEAADAAGVRVMEAFMYRLHPAWQAVRDLLASGAIGDLVAVQSWFSFFNDDPANIRNIHGYGGGALYDVGCYCVNLSRMLFENEPRRVVGSIVRDAVSGVDTTTSALLEFDGGSAGFTCSIRAEPDQRVHVHGSRGRISISIPFNIPADRPIDVLVTAGGDPPVAPRTTVRSFGPADPYAIEVERFAAAVLDGGPLPTPPEDAIANARVIESIFASDTTGDAARGDRHDR